MIELHYMSGAAFVFNIEDWKILRTQHRIIGDVVGCNQFLPSLPVALLPEEVVFLVQQNIAKLVKYEKLLEEPLKADKTACEKLANNLLQEQQKLFKETRKNQLQFMKDKIITAKRKNGDTRSSEEILEEEFNKSTHLDVNNMLWPIFMEHHKDSRGAPINVDLEEILKATTKVKCAAYKDLWTKGYFITLGHKFGGDFLAYLGDPIIHHAIYMIRCVTDINADIHPSELVAFGRLGTSVKKRAVLCGLNSFNNDVSYITLNWIDT